MEKLVHSYLSKNYCLLKNTGRAYFIYDKDDTNTIYLGSELIKELETIFSLDKVLAKKHVSSWAKVLKPRNTLKKYWAYWAGFGSIGLPLAIRIASRTIGLDLVSVQPMSEATGQLIYMDYQYTGNTCQEVVPDRNGRVFDAVAINRAVDEYIERGEERNRDERIRIILENQPIFVSSRGRDK